MKIDFGRVRAMRAQVVEALEHDTGKIVVSYTHANFFCAFRALNREIDLILSTFCLGLGTVKFGLYLPIIYKTDMFNPDDWYHPNGNDEWSFGISQFNSGDYLNGAIDFASDLALKIKFFELGRQLRGALIRLGQEALRLVEEACIFGREGHPVCHSPD